MDFIKFSIQNPTKITVGVILILLFGVIALDQIPTQLTPDVDRPIITVSTRWSGRSPEEVEESIILEQEEKLKAVQGLWKMTSSARLGQSFVTLEFNVGTDKSRAIQEVSNRLNEVPDYPENVDRPVIRMQDSASDEAIVYMLLQSDDPNFQVADFYDFADRFVKPPLERIECVAEVELRGGREHQVEVRFDPYKLAQREISPVELRNALRSDNVNESAGDLASGRLETRFRILGQYKSLEPLKETVIKRDQNGVPIRVRDVAEVELVLEKNIYFNQSRGKTSMSVFVKRETGANVLKIVKEVERRVEELNAPGGLLKHYKNDRYGLKLRITYKDSTYIESAIGLVTENMRTGGILAVLGLMLFLRSLRPTIIIALSIPISVVGTFVVMWVAGRNLNVVSLAGLSFAVGMVIDNAIVVLENIDRRLSMGEPILTAAYRGTKEVWGAILSATLTTVAVFAPVLTIREESGQLFYDLALAISASVMLSLLVSITVIPVACAHFLRPHKKAKGMLRLLDSLGGIAPLCKKMNNAFSRFLMFLMTRSVAGIWVRIVLVAGITLTSLGLSVYLMPPASYLPNGNKNYTSGRLVTPPSYSLMQNYAVGLRIEDTIRPYWEAKNSEEAGAIGELRDFQTGEVYEKVPPLKEYFFGVLSGSIFMLGVSDDPENVRPVASIFTQAMKQIPGAIGTAEQQSIFGRGAGSNSVDVEIFSDDIDRLRSSSSRLMVRLQDVFSKFAVRSSPPNFDEAGPEIRLVVDQVRAKDLNLSISDLAVAGRAMIDGAYVGDFNFDGQNIDMLIVRDPSQPLSPVTFKNLPISVRNEDGSSVILPLGSLVTEEKANSTQQIQRIEQQRAITLNVRPPTTMALEEAQRLIQQQVEICQESGELLPGVTVRFSGNSDRLTQVRTAMLGKWTGFNWESFYSLGLSRIFLALLIMYLLMSALFESFIYPFIILFSVPMAAIGGFIGLALVHAVDKSQQLDVLTMFGFIILIGIVINNAILIVHQALNFMKGFGESEEDIIDAMSPKEAICESVRTRMRPIFMTTGTSIFGMLPLVMSPGAGSELYRGLGAVVLGGLTFSTIFTLLVVPLVFSLVLDLTGKVEN